LLKDLFTPKSIAVIGVSSNPSKLGSVIFNNIIVSGYRGKVFPVNPKYKDIFGRKCFPTIEAIPEPVEQAIFIIPAENVVSELEKAGKRKGIKSAVIISAGFKEVGEEGLLLEQKLLEIAQKYNIRILGPNCLGYINPYASLNASFAASNPVEGNIFFLSQSGAFCTALLDMAVNNNLGFSKFVSFGNKTDINEIELIEEAFRSNDTGVIGLYVEQISDGGELCNLIRDNREKPVIIMNPGKSDQAQKAISSHTGSLTGSAKLREQALRQSGAILVNRMEEMYNLLLGFSWSKPLEGNRIAVVTNAGGPGIIATDYLVEKGLEVAHISNKTAIELKKKLPPTASVKNPIDVIGDALAERYYGVLETLSQDENIDAILVILTPQFVTQIEETAKLIISESKTCQKPIFVAFIGGKYAWTGLERFYDNKIPAFVFVEDAIDTMSKLYAFYEYNKSYHNLNADLKNTLKAVSNKPGLKFEIAKHLTNEPTVLPESLVEKLCDEFEIDIPKQIRTNDIADINKFLKQNERIVIKAESEDLIHKTDFKGLYLNITNQDEAGFAYYQLQKNIAKAKGQSLKQMHELLVQEQINGGEELFIGINRDGSSNVYENKADQGFGHQILFGKGGIYTEVYKDISLRLLPLSDTGFEELINSTKVNSVLNGARGEKVLARSKLITLLEKLQKMVFTYPEIVSMDVNPVIVTTKRAIAVDIKIFIKE
jgi:acetyl coenzyme A synthetase (ADP forming)-like protein